MQYLKHVLKPSLLNSILHQDKKMKYGMNKETGKILTGQRHLKQSITDILTTPVGSRVMKREYGSRLFEMIDRPVNAQFKADVTREVAGSLARWEPRVQVKNVSVSTTENGSIVLDLSVFDKTAQQSLFISGVKI